MRLAGELALAGVDTALIERRVSRDVDGMRAGGLLARTLEELDLRGLAERFTSQGKPSNHFEFAGVPLDMKMLATRHDHVLALGQQHVERILADWLTELAVPILRGREVTGLTQDADGVDVSLADGDRLRARYLVGCDGGRSAVRRAAGIEFSGTDATTTNLIAEVQFAQEPPWGIRRDERGIHGIGKLDAGGARVMVTERSVDLSREPTLDDLRAEMVAAFGSDYGVHSPTWLSRFSDATRQAAAYRRERVLLAGDAAHVHPPDGGQGLQTGLQDAVNLGWKLARVVQGQSPALLDSYHAERHPVAKRVIRNTKVFVTLRRDDDRTASLKQVFAELLAVDAARERVTAMLAGLDIRYDFGDGHPLLGRRMPDLDLETPDGRKRVSTLLHDGLPVLVDFSGVECFQLEPWKTRVRRVVAKSAGDWKLPAVGVVAAPSAVLIRPDGYVAWVSDGGPAGLIDALLRWFGPPSR